MAWRRWLQRWTGSRQAARPFDLAAHHDTVARLPGLAELPDDARARLQSLAREFVASRHFHGHDGQPVSAARQAIIATLASWPMLNLGHAAFAGWRDLVLYPGGFRARRHVTADDEGMLAVVHEYDEDLSGEAGDGGAVVLSWDEIELDLERPQDGQSVVIHEVAHMLDRLSGTIDGRPPLLPGMSAQLWTQSFQQAFDELQSLLDAGGESLIDPYAAEAPEEFFAVAVEHYCLRPDLLQQQCPAVWGQLRELLGRVRGDAT